MPPGDQLGVHSAGPKPTAPRPKCQPANCGCGSAPTAEKKTWTPDYVADQLAGTRQAADKHRHDATLEAQAAATGEDDTTSRLHGDAADSAALAQALDERARHLAEADDVRAAWYAHTAETRAAAERAAAELADRRADHTAEPPPLTAKEWLAAHDAEARAEDPHRPVNDEHELAGTADPACPRPTRSQSKGAVARVGRDFPARHP